MSEKINYNGIGYFPLELALLKGENRAFKQLLLFGGKYVNFRVNFNKKIYFEDECSSEIHSVSGNILHAAVMSDQISLLSHILKWLSNYDNHNHNQDYEKIEIEVEKNSNLNNSRDYTGRNHIEHSLTGILGKDNDWISTCTHSHSLLFDLLGGTDKSVRTPLSLAQDLKKVRHKLINKLIN